MKGSELVIDDHHWVVGEQIDRGGFGRVFELEGDEPLSVAKFVPKEPGANRELLFVDLPNAVNVVPVTHTGDHEGHWVLVMPRAEKSLKKHLESSDGAAALTEALEILADVCEALVSIEGVVHRDIKPGNILLYEGKWCLADFGIARYIETSTSADTHKFALSDAYAAPERWRFESATPATDVYSVGVIAYEMVSGERPFKGPTRDQFREQHLHETPLSLEDVPVSFSTLVDECLFKAPGSRPTPENLKAKIDRIPDAPPTGGIAALAEANRLVVLERSEMGRAQSEKQTAAERRTALAEAGHAQYLLISEKLRQAILSTATAAGHSEVKDGAWNIKIREAGLTLLAADPQRENRLVFADEKVAFDVILSSQLGLGIPPSPTGWEGRSHSLWYCDAKEKDYFGWYETAFMVNPVVRGSSRQAPFALDPGEEAAKAILPIMTEFQLAWPFTSLGDEGLEEFVDRWAGWLGEAAQGRLSHPSRMPERDNPQGSFRR